MVRLRHEVITSASGLATIEPAWAAASRGTGVPFLQPEWTVAAAAAWGPGALVLHVVLDGDEVAAVAPMRRVRSSAGTRLTTLWDVTGEPTMFFHRDEAALAALAAGLVSGRRPLSLPRLDSDGPELEALRSTLRGRGMTMLNSPGQVGFAPYADHWHDFEMQLSTSSRSWLRRKVKKLATSGPVTVDALSPGPDEVGACLERLMKVEAAGWKGRAGTAIAQDPWLQRFLTDYTALAAARNDVRFYFLNVGDQAVAAHLYVEQGRRLWQLKIGYDETYAACSPGILLMHEVHQRGHERGLLGCEYLGSAESWQSRWPVRLRDQQRLLVYPAGASGLAHVVRDSTKGLGRRMAARSASGGLLRRP
jgi:CelD/BcsL family acetyltransferase involved in cellulose biosynthesis